MALLDNVIREVEQQFGLGNKSAGFIGETLNELFDAKQGDCVGSSIDSRTPGSKTLPPPGSPRAATICR